MSNRSADLLLAAMDWLESDPEIIEILGGEGSGIYGEGLYGEGIYHGQVLEGNIYPVQVAQGAKESDPVNQMDPRVFVGVSTTSSERQNKHEAVEYEVRVIVDATKDWVEGEDGSTIDLTRLKNRVEDVLTTHRDGWGAQGVQADDEIAWDDDLKRYLGVTSFGFERTDRHDAHTE